jgi:ABC-type Fe3+ transport system permease subunit
VLSDHDSAPAQGRSHQIGLWGPFACGAVIAISVGLPLGVIASQASGEALAQALSLADRPLTNSFVVATLGATMLVLLGLGVGYTVDRGRAYSLDVAGMILFALPATITGIGLITFWNTPLLSGVVYNTRAIIIIGYLSRFLILTERIFVSTLAQLPISSEESARVDGATAWQVAGYVVLPMMRPAIVTAWILAFIFCFGELTTTIVVYPAGGSTLPISLYTIMANSPEPLTASMSLLLVIPILVAVSLFLAFAQRMRLLTL